MPYKLASRIATQRDVSESKHPYLVIEIDEEYCVAEIAQLDSIAGKEYKAAFKCNKIIMSTNPDEAVISKDSFIQMDNKFTLELSDDLEKYLRTQDTLSEDKLQETITAYREYQESHHISENKIIHFLINEIENLND